MEATYITNVKGKRISVVLSLKQYQVLLDAKEELDDIRLYDAVKARKEPRVSIEQYVANRKKKGHAKV